jgi:hypothetical protein
MRVDMIRKLRAAVLVIIVIWAIKNPESVAQIVHQFFRTLAVLVRAGATGLAGCGKSG